MLDPLARLGHIGAMRSLFSRWARRRTLLLGLWLSLACQQAWADAATARTLEALPYAGADAAQTLDLHLPAQFAPGQPLLIFVPGGFWGEPDPRFALPDAAVRVLQERGLAVAVVRTRPAPAHRHPAQAEDVAAAVAWLLGNAGQYGYNRERTYLAGHSSGGQLAALVGLDPRYLRGVGLRPRDLAGVVALSAMFDLSDDAVDNPDQRTLYTRAFGDHAQRTAASPIQHVGADSPPFLVLSAVDDLPGLTVAARRFTEALRAAGNDRAFYHVLNRNHHLSVIDFAGAGQTALGYLLAFTGVDEGNEFFALRHQARHRWHEPPVSTEPFWRDPALVQSHAMERGVVERLVALMQGNAYMLSAWPLRRYHAVDLQQWLRAQPKAKLGSGRWLTTTNLRGEKLYYDLEQIAAYEPVIVVGLDDTRNLFKLTTFYRANQQYSWIDGEPRPPLMVRPVGAFLYFRKPVPESLRPRFFADYSLTVDSFRLTDDDPIAAVRDIPETLRPVFGHENGCISCHGFRGVPVQAHHVRAMNLEPHGGNALPLTSYPPQVWQRFLFEQERVAKKIGVTPNPVREDLVPALYELVNKERDAQTGPRPTAPETGAARP